MYPVYDINNCYIDSILVALFAPEPRSTGNTSLDRFFIGTGDLSPVQRCLRELIGLIRYSKTDHCYNTSAFRLLLFGQHPTANFSQDTATDPKDAADFLAYFLDIFPIPGTIVERTRRLEYRPILVRGNPGVFDSIDSIDFGEPDSGDSAIRFENRSLWVISSGALVEGRPISTYLETREVFEQLGLEKAISTPHGALVVRVPFKLIKNTAFDYSTCPCLFICPSRNENDTTAVVPEDFFVKGGRVFQFTSVICFRAGHYTCYYRRSGVRNSGVRNSGVRNSGVWHHYNDIGHTPGTFLDTEVSYADMLLDCSRHGVIYVYVYR